MLSMVELKAHLASFADERHWQEKDKMATDAIYALVSKAVLRIDRRGKPMVGFK